MRKKQAITNHKIKQRYEITVTKIVDGKEQQITSVHKNTNSTGKFRITLDIPEEYRGHRHYSILHEHHGEIVRLTDLDDDPNKITIEVDAFSAFTLTATDDFLTTESPDLFAFYATNMTLGNTLNLNFAVAKSLITDEGSYAKLVRTYADGKADHEVTLEKSQWTVQDDLYLITYEDLAAKEMCDKVTVRIFNSAGVQISETKTDSIRSYAMRCLGKDGYTDEEKTMFMEMLNYGAEAQKQFGYNIENLSNAGCEAYADYNKQHSEITNSSSPVGGLYMGTSLVLENNIEMQMGFTGSPEGVSATVSYTHHDGETKSFAISSDKFYAYKGENGETIAYGVIIPEIVVADARQNVTVTLTLADGSPLTVVDSIAAYVKRNGDSGVYNAIMDFSDAAYAYLH